MPNPIVKPIRPEDIDTSKTSIVPEDLAKLLKEKNLLLVAPLEPDTTLHDIWYQLEPLNEELAEKVQEKLSNG